MVNLRKVLKRKNTSSTKTTASGTKHTVIGVAWMVVGVILLAYLVYGALLYLNGWSGSTTRTITNIFCYPASSLIVPGYSWWFLLSFFMVLLLVLSAGKLVYLGVTNRLGKNAKTIVTGFVLVAAAVSMVSVPNPSNTTVGYHSYLERFQALKTFQDKRNQVSPQNAQALSDDDLKAQAVQQLMLADFIRQEATKFNVKVSQKDVNQTYKQYVDQNQGEENLKKQLKDFLGWGPAEFKQEIKVKLLEEKLNSALATDDEANKDRKKRAEDYLKQVKGGQDFAEVAKGSDDPTAQNGGDMGFIKKGENDPAIEAVAFSLPPGQVSDVIKTQRGYVIVKVEEKNADQVRIREIVVRTQSLSEFSPDQLKNAKVNIYVKGLIWDKTLYAVQPKNKPQPTAPNPSASPAPAAATPAVQ